MGFFVIDALIGITINAPMNTAMKSTIAIPVVTNKSQNISIAALIANSIQNTFFELSFEIIFDKGLYTNTEM